MRDFILGVCQTPVHEDINKNLREMHAAVKSAANGGADIAALGECFYAPYDIAGFNSIAQPLDGEAARYMSKAAAEAGIYLIGGSIIERAQDGRLYNTCCCFDPKGDLICVYRKTHLFDMRIPGMAEVSESSVITPGSTIEVFETPFARIGLGICYDLRFPQFSAALRDSGAEVCVFPSAFTMPTGEQHFDMLLRARAVDNGMYVAGVSAARAERGFQAYANSRVIDPMGIVLAQAGTAPQTLLVKLKKRALDETREALRMHEQRRDDLY